MRPHTVADRVAYLTTRVPSSLVLERSFEVIHEALDLLSGFKLRREKAWLKRLQLLELAATAWPGLLRYIMR